MNTIYTRRIHDVIGEIPIDQKKIIIWFEICVVADSNEDWQTDDWNVPMLSSLTYSSSYYSSPYARRNQSSVWFSCEFANSIRDCTGDCCIKCFAQCIFLSSTIYASSPREESDGDAWTASESLLPTPPYSSLFQSLIQFTRRIIEILVHLVTRIHTLPYARYVPISMSIPSRISISIWSSRCFSDRWGTDCTSRSRLLSRVDDLSFSRGKWWYWWAAWPFMGRVG